MTQQEFETRTGISYAHGEFEDMVNPIYMAAGQMNKDAFCAEFKKHSAYLLNSRIVSELVAEVETLRAKLQNYEHEIKAIETSRNALIDELAHFIADMAHLAFNGISNGSELRKKAIEVLGKREYLKHFITRGYELEQFDRDALIEILK